MSSQFAQWLDAADASERAGITLHRGGLWFSGGGVVSARRWCRAMLESQREDITLRTAETAAGLAPCADGWRATDPGGRTLGTAPVVLVAAALAAPGLLGLRCAPVRPVRGRLSLLRAGDLAKLRVGLAGEGYAIRGRDGTVGVGASYEIPPADAGGACYAPDEDIHRGNLQRLARLFVDPVAVAVSGMFDGMRCVANDRLPFAGPVADEAGALANQQVLRGAHLAELPRRRGLCASFAFGSRGLTLASLAAELIAAQLEGEPWPIERNLAAAIDPARVLLRRLRSTRPSAEPPFAA
jgi:tRNA 5-methylaminomethyl-2-thiouridine biosynthesis bifunctional protein